MQTPNGIITKNVTGLFWEKTVSSEQVTQAIMGQPVHIEKEEDKWMWVETWDTYHGWVMSRNVGRTIPQPELIATVTTLFTDVLIEADADGEIFTKLVLTASVEALNGGKADQSGLVAVRLPDGTQGWVNGSDIKLTAAGEDPWPFDPNRATFPRTGRRLRGVPYFWGGTSPFGIDCSGFVQIIHKVHGINLLRDADQQAQDSRAIPIERADIQAGDMVFFAGGEDKSRITHVGMACDALTFVHSAGQGQGVIINNLSDKPFDANYWGARRMPNDPAQRNLL
jgi:gamma-D-glutamyl-L-lysine dipeptidyl-peptidase